MKTGPKESGKAEIQKAKKPAASASVDVAKGDKVVGSSDVGIPKTPLVPAHERPPIVAFARPPRHRRRLALLIVLAVVVIAGAGVAGYSLINHKPAKENQVSTAPRKPVAKKPVAVPTDPILARFTHPATGETWLPTPKQVGDLGYIDDPDGGDVSYYRVGAHGQNIIYMSITQDLGSFTMLYEKAPDGTVRAVLQPDANEDYTSDYNSSAKESLTQKVIADTTIHYDSLTMPDSFSIGHGDSVIPNLYGGLDIGSLIAPSTDSGTTKTVIATYGGSKLIKFERRYVDTGLTAINYAIDLPTGTELNLAYTPINKDLSTYTWNNGVNVASSTNGSDAPSSDISGIVRGCGSAALSVSRADTASDSDFVAAGKTSDGKTVYAFASSNDPLVQKSYSEYQSSWVGTTGVTIVSLNTFLEQHALVAYKDGTGEWLVYTRDQYAADGGCAKPVVYLYPTHAEDVTVRVGADVTKSAPLYDPNTGWKVYAQPNGHLTVDGQSYGSLFWEGYGSGLYPAITNGTVVKRANALSTIRAQLKQQGLTSSEINDFVTYWQNKIPNEPYVRLTWLNTSEMNQLAPLTITPKPTTLIRVFLDMDGYTIPPKLPSQHLVSTPRKGFTVVEWGGLSQSSLQ